MPDHMNIMKLKWLFNTNKGPSQMLPSDSALAVQYGSGPSNEFLVRTSGVDTVPFFWIHDFIFQFVRWYFISLTEEAFIWFTVIVQLEACMTMVCVTWLQFPNRLLLLITRFVMAAEAIKSHLFFKSSHSFLFLFPVFMLEKERSAADISYYDKLNYYYLTPFQNVSLPFRLLAFTFSH
jgi:hypothetical protein